MWASFLTVIDHCQRIRFLSALRECRIISRGFANLSKNNFTSFLRTCPPSPSILDILRRPLR